EKWSRAGLTTGTKAHKIRVRLLCRSVRRNCPLVQRQDSRFWICLSGFESLGGNQTFEAITYLSGCGRVRKIHSVSNDVYPGCGSDLDGTARLTNFVPPDL